MTHKDKSKIAIEKFCHANCAQSVLFAFAEDFGLEEKMALKIAAGFGAGMGRVQSVCGAVSGAIMVIGLKYGNDVEITYEKTRDFIQKFKEITSTIECIDLLDGCNLRTKEGQAYFKENGLRQKKCREYVKLSCDILDEIISKNNLADIQEE